MDTTHYLNISLQYALNTLGAVAILALGWAAAGWVARLITRAFERLPANDPTLTHFLSSLARYGLLLITGMAVLGQFGVQTASLVAVLGAAGLAIGLALQGTLSHVAAGVMLLLFRPFKVGDMVETAGQSGKVEAIGLFLTELRAENDLHILIPNGQIWNGAVKNHSTYARKAA
jgi:small conductance mechanosensitive channel